MVIFLSTLISGGEHPLTAKLDLRPYKKHGITRKKISQPNIINEYKPVFIIAKITLPDLAVFEFVLGGEYKHRINGSSIPQVENFSITHHTLIKMSYPKEIFSIVEKETEPLAYEENEDYYIFKKEFEVYSENENSSVYLEDIWPIVEDFDKRIHIKP